MVYRAAQNNPTKSLIDIMAADISMSSSVEKLDILFFAVKNNEYYQGGSVAQMANELLTPECQFSTGTETSVSDYFISKVGQKFSILVRKSSHFSTLE